MNETKQKPKKKKQDNWGSWAPIIVPGVLFALMLACLAAAIFVARCAWEAGS